MNSCVLSDHQFDTLCATVGLMCFLWFLWKMRNYFFMQPEDDREYK